jgi:hypothetical protein
MRFLEAFCWEFVQNLPLVGGFLLGLDFWQRGRLGVAIAFMVVGSVTGSAMIWATESRIVKGHREPIQVVVTNVLAMSSLMILLTMYMSSQWSGWWSDLLIGFMGGVGLGAIQSLAIKSPVSLGHCMAFALSFALGLVGIRVLAATVSVGANILVVTTVVTAVITIVDYGPSR